VTGFRVGIDIGGTFTDIVLLGEDGRVHTRKVSSTVDDYAAAIATGLAELFAATGVGAAAIREIRHGTTVASNAILEGKGARMGLIATKGFRDILEIRNLRVPELYNIGWRKPPVLIPRHLRVVVDERIAVDGTVRRPLDPAGAERAVDALLAAGVEVIAVCLLNAFANPAHEALIAETARRKAPHLPLSVASEVLPVIKEYERTSTTVVNGYVLPVVGRYLASMRRVLADRQIVAPLLVMQSSGGLTTAEEASAKPVNIIESGPAGGVIGAHALARTQGLANLISFDMGGTTAKAALIEGGAIARSPEFQVGGGILTGSRLMTGAGYLIKAPAVDLAEVGAGGGSIVGLDAAGSLRVGPESAGAYPGPLCYGLGGTEPTVTDANVLLGYLNPERLVGGELLLDAAHAREVFHSKVAAPLGLPSEQAAYGVHRIAAAAMIRAIRAVTSERGRDPRDFALCAFGGNGPVFAAAMAADLGIAEVLIPPAPGLFSAFGLLYADVGHHYARTLQRLVAAADPAEVQGVFADLEARARAQLRADGFAAERTAIRRSAELHYKGQTHELTVAVPQGPIDAAALAEIAERFHAEHERTYGHRTGKDGAASAGEPVELVNLHVVGIGRPERPAAPRRRHASEPPAAAPASPRPAYFGPEHGWRDTPVLTRRDLATAREGPCIVEEYDATCVVPPGVSAKLDDSGNIRLGVGRKFGDSKVQHSKVGDSI
jgi:N-methylhydantoinase A